MALQKNVLKVKILLVAGQGKSFAYCNHALLHILEKYYFFF